MTSLPLGCLLLVVALAANLNGDGDLACYKSSG